LQNVSLASRRLGHAVGVILADASKKIACPPGVLLEAMVEPEAWLTLAPREVYPEATLMGVSRVRWTSLWPKAPHDVIDIDVSREQATILRFRWWTDSPPDDRGIGKVRFRLNYIFGSELRGAVYQGRFHRRDHAHQPSEPTSPLVTSADTGSSDPGEP